MPWPLSPDDSAWRRTPSSCGPRPPARTSPDGRRAGGAAEILLCRLAPRISRSELWTLPGGGLDHGEDPRDALLREIVEETGLEAVVGDTARVYSAHLPRRVRDGVLTDFHALRIVYDAWVRADAPAPRVARGRRVHRRGGVAPGGGGRGRRGAGGGHGDRGAGRPPAAAAAAGGGLRAGPRATGRVLLTRLSARAAHPGSWTLPGGGIDHGERPAAALVREVAEECGVECAVGELLVVHDTHFSGTAPSGRWEDYHGVHLVFAATRGRGRRAPGRRGRRHHRRGGVGRRWPTSRRAPCRSSTW